MKLNFIIDKNTDEYRALCEVSGEVGFKLCDDGIPVALKQTDGPLKVFSNGSTVTIEYPTRICLMRSIGLLARYLPKGGFDVMQSPSYDLGIMADCSRNAVLNIPTVKKMCRIIAAMGYNTLMLYTEDTYEIEEYPYFGHFRGRYTKEQLREIDAYAAMLGVELVPCIQTLAHLNAIFQWPAFGRYKDINDILLVGADHVYKLIDAMLSSMKDSIKSRKINIGMDEAFWLGHGAYLKANGFRKKSDIMLEHLAKVTELCKKHGYEPMMWSDMFFSMASKTGAHYDQEAEFSADIIAKVPPEVTLVYWDYFGTDENKYEKLLEKHEEFNNPIAFAGGSSIWYGLIPLNRYSINSAHAALKCVNRHNVKQVLVTMWGDDGGICSKFCALPTLTLYSEYCWGGDTSDSALSEALYAVAKADLNDFLDMELPVNFPGRTNYGESNLNSHRYMFFQDALSGKFDFHIPVGTGEHFARCRDIFKEKRDRNPEWIYIFDSLIAFCDVLSDKAELGINLKTAYDKGDKIELERIRDEVIPSLVGKLETLYSCIREQWKKDNKLFGMDIQDLRFGGLIMRIKDVGLILDDYLSNRIERIEELEQPRLPYNSKCPEGTPIYLNRWNHFVTSNVLYMM